MLHPSVRTSGLGPGFSSSPAWPARPRSRGHAIFALGRSQEPEDAAFIRAPYPRLRGDELKEKASFSLPRVRAAESARWLPARTSDRGDSDRVREQAVLALSQRSRDEGTRAPIAREPRALDLSEEIPRGR